MKNDRLNTLHSAIEMRMLCKWHIIHTHAQILLCDSNRVNVKFMRGFILIFFLFLFWCHPPFHRRQFFMTFLFFFAHLFVSFGFTWRYFTFSFETSQPWPYSVQRAELLLHFRYTLFDECRRVDDVDDAEWKHMKHETAVEKKILIWKLFIVKVTNEPLFLEKCGDFSLRFVG